MPQKQIIWEPKKVKLDDVIENPHNPKILSELGEERLQSSLSMFGLAGTIICNTDPAFPGKYLIVDGHSRVREQKDKGTKQIWISLPDRPLTKDEYDKMNALFDVAKASEPDRFMIEQIVGDDLFSEFMGEGKANKKEQQYAKDEKNAKYPLVPQYDEKYEAIVIVCSNSIDTVFIKNALGISQEMSYKNKMVKETSVITARNFITKWTSK